MLKYNNRTPRRGNDQGSMSKAQRKPNIQTPRRKLRLWLAPPLPTLAIERLKTPEYTSIHMLKTFLISKSRSFILVREAASGGVAELEMAVVEGVRDGNTDKYAYGRVCSRIFKGGVKKLQAPMTDDQPPSSCLERAAGMVLPHAIFRGFQL
jgi:hypothetical protein